MDVTVEDLSSVKKKLHIEIPEDVVVREVDKAYKDLKKTAKIRGFRPGKAPRAVLERHYRKDVNADVSSKLIQDSFSQAIQEKKLNVIGTPRFIPADLDDKKSYAYDVVVDINPDLEDIDFKNIPIKKTIYKVGDDEIRAQLKMLQQNLAEYKPIDEDRAVENGDFVLIDYEGFKDGKPFEETGATENFQMKIGEGKILKDLDDEIIGMKPEETKEIRVTFPQNYKNKNLAGNEINFKVTLKEIQKQILPEINDEFAKKFGELKSLDELKGKIIDNLKEGYEKRTEQEVNEQIFSALLTKCEFEAPDPLVEYELEGILNETLRSLEHNNMTMDDLGITEDSIKERYRGTAIDQVKRHMILAKIIEQEELSLTDDELNKGFEDIAKQFGFPVDDVKRYYNESSGQANLKYLEDTLLEKKALRMIIDHADIEEVQPGENQEESYENKEEEK